MPIGGRKVHQPYRELIDRKVLNASMRCVKFFLAKRNSMIRKQYKMIKAFFELNGLVVPKSKIEANVRLIELYKSGTNEFCKDGVCVKPIVNRPPIYTKKVDDYKQKYLDYLNSPEWKSFRLAVLNHYGHSCILCNSTKNLQIHHRHYKNLYHETFADVIPLCAGCHKKHHKK